MSLRDYRKSAPRSFRKDRFVRIFWGIVFVAGLILLGGNRGKAAIIQAASMANSDVIAAVAQAQDGDTVVVPPGVAKWTQCVAVSNAITLQFAGVGQSIVQDYIVCPQPGNIPPWSEGVITFFTTSNKLYRLTGLEIDAGLVRASSNAFVHGSVEVMGTTTGFRIDHCSFNNINDDAIYIYNAACGLIDHCSFYNLQGQAAHGICVNHENWANQSYGDGAWNNPVEWGTTNAVYIEDCAGTNTIASAWAMVDSFGGAHYVFRHNTVVNGFVCNHGTESTGLDRSTRSEEVYLNTFIHSNYVDAVNFRGGTGVVWSNTAVGYQNMVIVCSYRCSDFYNYWGAADGTNVLDLDLNTNAPIMTVTHSGPNNSPTLVVSNANWTPNQWLGYSVIDITEPGTTNYGMISSNSANTAYLLVPQIHNRTVFNTGDTVQIYHVNQVLDMPGTSTAAPLRRDPKSGQPLAPWPSQTIEPVYSWGNSLNGVESGVVTAFPVISPGIYFTNGVAKPGYAPLTYPHPLTFMASAGTGPLEAPPDPPTNLRVAISP